MDKEEPQNPSRVPSERSAAYPAINLEDAVAAMEKLRKNLGASVKYDRDAAVKGLGYAGISGASARKVAALAHYGLLVREGNTYRQSPLATSIAAALGEDERKAAIQEAAKTPRIFSRLFEQLNGQAVPGMLSNLLSRQYGISEKVSKEVGDIFRQTAEYSGLLINGVLGATAEDALSRSNEVTEEIMDKPGTGQFMNPPKPMVASSIDYPLAGGIVVTFPMSLSRHLTLGEFAEAIRNFEKEVTRVVQPLANEEGHE